MTVQEYQFRVMRTMPFIYTWYIYKIYNYSLVETFNRGKTGFPSYPGFYPHVDVSLNN